MKFAEYFEKAEKIILEDLRKGAVDKEKGVQNLDADNNDKFGIGFLAARLAYLGVKSMMIGERLVPMNKENLAKAISILLKSIGKDMTPEQVTEDYKITGAAFNQVQFEIRTTDAAVLANKLKELVARNEKLQMKTPKVGVEDPGTDQGSIIAGKKKIDGKYL